jgi:histidyl-tRNA synthetase
MGYPKKLDGPPTKASAWDGFGASDPVYSGYFSACPGLSPRIFLAPIGREAFERATLLAHKLRTAGKRVYLDFDARSLKSQMRLADKLNAKAVVIIGEEELKSGTVVVRDMATKDQRTVPEHEL